MHLDLATLLLHGLMVLLPVLGEQLLQVRAVTGMLHFTTWS